MDYETTIRNLFAILAQANSADTDEALPWQHPRDTSNFGLYGCIRFALVAIAGEEIVTHWEESSEIEMEHANRR